MAASFKAIFEVALPAAILSVRVAIRTECLTAASAGDSVESLPLNLATMRIPPCHPALVRAEFLCPVARCRYQRLSADWTLNVMLFDEFIHLLEGHVIDIGIWEFGFDEFIGTVTGFASLAVDHWIVEGGNVSGSFPNAWIHEDASIDADIGW